MRVINFRAWDSHNKVMINPYAELKGGKFWGEDLTNTGYAEPLPEHIMQFVGKKDDNGKDIYEGDILRIHEKLANFPLDWVVVFNDTTLAFTLRWVCRYSGNAADTIGFYDMQLKRSNHKVFEIIGNIYENPELLK